MRRISAAILIAMLMVPNAGICGGMLVYDAINYLQALLQYLKEIEECISIVNMEWTTIEEYRRKIEEVKRKVNEYERMIKAGEKIVNLIEDDKWKDAAKRTRRLYDWGLDEFFDKRHGAPVDIDELLGKHFYLPRTPDDVITDMEDEEIESEKTKREVRLNYEELEALKRRLKYAAGTQSESDRRREELFPKTREMVDEAGGDSIEALLKATAEQNMILMQQLQDLIDQQTQAALNQDNKQMKESSESAEFIDYEVKRQKNRKPTEYKWPDDRISGGL